MEIFKKKNDLGIEFECGIIATTNIDGIEYTVYTDFTEIVPDELKLSVGRMNGKKIEDIDEALERKIIDDLLDSQEEYIKNFKEGQRWNTKI